MKTSPYLLSILVLFLSCGSPSTKKDSAPISPIIVPTSVDKVVGIAQIQPENNIIQFSSSVNGIVSKILKKENDSVRLGEPILELDHTLEDAKLSQLRDDVNTQKDQIQADKSSIEEYQAKFSNAKLELGRLENLYKQGAETQQNVDNSRTNLLAFSSNLNRLQNNVKVSESKFKETLAAVKVSLEERKLKIITSPVKGKILEIMPVLGNSIDNKSALGQISPIGNIIAIGEIDELFADKIKEGQKAWIRNLGSMDTLSTGTVYFASSFLKKKSLFTDQPGEKEDRRVREIKIILDHPENLLLNARVECIVRVTVNSKK